MKNYNYTKNLSSEFFIFKNHNEIYYDGKWRKKHFNDKPFSTIIKHEIVENIQIIHSKNGETNEIIIYFFEEKGKVYCSISYLEENTQGLYEDLKYNSLEYLVNG